MLAQVQYTQTKNNLPGYNPVTAKDVDHKTDVQHTKSYVITML